MWVVPGGQARAPCWPWADSQCSNKKQPFFYFSFLWLFYRLFCGHTLGCSNVWLSMLHCVLSSWSVQSKALYFTAPVSIGVIPKSKDSMFDSSCTKSTYLKCQAVGLLGWSKQNKTIQKPRLVPDFGIRPRKENLLVLVLRRPDIHPWALVNITA